MNDLMILACMKFILTAVIAIMVLNLVREGLLSVSLGV
nr:MAG TPA: hypothetical protein [Bacteriophage sp.]